MRVIKDIKYQGKDNREGNKDSVRLTKRCKCHKSNLMSVDLSSNQKEGHINNHKIITTLIYQLNSLIAIIIIVNKIVITRIIELLLNKQQNHLICQYHKSNRSMIDTIIQIRV